MRAVLILLCAVLLAAGASWTASAGDSFAILSEDATETSRVVAVRIERRLSEEGLLRLAASIRQSDASTTRRHTVVSFYLPGMPSDQRPWASVDATPAPKAIVAGLTLSEEKALIAETGKDKRDLAGAWITELPAQPGRIVILNEDGKVLLEETDRTGHRRQEEMVASRAGRGAVRFDSAAGGDEHYILQATGELEQRSGDRLVSVAHPIPLGRTAPILITKGSGEISSATASADPLAPAERKAGATGAVAAPMAHSEKPGVAGVASKPVKRVRRLAQGRKRPSAVSTADYIRPMTSNN